MPSASSDPIREVDSMFDQSRSHTAEVRRHSVDDGVSSKQQQQLLLRNNNNRLLRRTRSVEPPAHNKKKNLVQKGLAFLLDSTASVARNPSTVGTTATPTTPPPCSSSSSPFIPWSPNNKQQHQDVGHDDGGDDDDDDDRNKTKFASDDRNKKDHHHHHHEHHAAGSESPVPQVQECDTYESEFSGYSSPLAGHDFKILPNNGVGGERHEPPQQETTLPFVESPSRSSHVQTIEPCVASPTRDSTSQPARRRNKHRTNRSKQHDKPSSARGSSRQNHHHHHHHTGSGAADAPGVAGAVTRFLCGAIPTACGGAGGETFRERQQRQHDDDNDNNFGNEDDRRSRLRNLFQPLRNKVRQHFPHNGGDYSEDDPSLDRSFLTSTTASTTARRDPSTSPNRSSTTSTAQKQGGDRTMAGSFFHKYLDFVDAIGLASSTLEDDDATTTTISAAARTMASSIMNHSRMSEMTPYYRRRTTTNTMSESVATASVITHEEEQDESLNSVEMTYHDQHEDNNEQQQQVPVPSMTTSSGSSSSEAEYDDDDNDHDDDDNGGAAGDGDDDSITASDESVLSHVSKQMTIEDADSEESLLYSARLSLDDDDVDTLNIIELGDSTIVNISLREQSVEYGGVEYAVKITPPRITSQRADDETFGTPNSNQSPSSSNTRQQQAELVQLNQTALPLFTLGFDEHEEEGEERPLNHTRESEYYGNFKDDSMEEQIEAVFCTKKWMSEDDQCEGDIVFTKASAREINYETSSDSSVVVDHVFGWI